MFTVKELMLSPAGTVAEPLAAVLDDDVAGVLAADEAGACDGASDLHPVPRRRSLGLRRDITTAADLWHNS